MEPNDTSNMKHTPPGDDSSNQTTPPPGPPRKGFWGFLASFFPKDHPMADNTPSSESNDPTQHETPSAPANSTSSKSNENQQDQQTLNDQAQAAQQQEPHTPISGAPDVDESQVPQTDEEGGPNADGEKTPPTLAAPQEVKAPASEENEGNPVILPTEPEGSGGSRDDDSTPNPGEPYDPKQK